MTQIREISFHDTKTVVDKETGEAKEVMAFIPDCCREGWESCQHVIKNQKPAKKNVGL